MKARTVDFWTSEAAPPTIYGGKKSDMGQFQASTIHTLEWGIAVSRKGVNVMSVCYTLNTKSVDLGYSKEMVSRKQGSLGIGLERRHLKRKRMNFFAGFKEANSHGGTGHRAGTQVWAQLGAALANSQQGK